MKRALPLLLALSLAQGLPASAQQAPDAGRVLQQNQTPLRLPPPEPAPIEPDAIRPILSVPQGTHFTVSDFRITGATVIAVSELHALLKPWIGKDLGLPELSRAAERITTYYHERGYFVARAYLPAQEIKGGVVEILVVEGKLGKVEIHLAGKTRISEAFLENEVAAAVPAGTVIRRDALERGVLLINDLPGVQARATLLPGTEQATTNLQLGVREGPLLTGSLEYDNYGNKFTGQQRPGARINLNDALGRGDQLQFYYAGLSDNEYFSTAFGLPVGDRGLRIGAGYTYTNYHLCCDFEALDATGRAKVVDVNANYPLVRSSVFNLSGIANLEHKTFYNATNQGEVSDKVIDVLTLAANLDGRDSFLGGGSTFSSISAAYGHVNHDGFAPDAAQDAVTANTQGDYLKGYLTASRLQAVATDWSLYGNLVVQLSDKNLDSAEKISLGGINGVRSYPTNEAIADSAGVINLELHHNLDEFLQLFGLLDYGYVELHHSTWSGWQGANPALRNSYGLAGTGLGADYEQPGNFRLRGIVAERLGVNPGSDIHGNDSDGSHSRTRLWLQAIKYL